MRPREKQRWVLLASLFSPMASESSSKAKKTSGRRKLTGEEFVAQENPACSLDVVEDSGSREPLQTSFEDSYSVIDQDEIQAVAHPDIQADSQETAQANGLVVAQSEHLETFQEITPEETQTPPQEQSQAYQPTQPTPPDLNRRARDFFHDIPFSKRSSDPQPRPAPQRGWRSVSARDFLSQWVPWDSGRANGPGLQHLIQMATQDALRRASLASPAAPSGASKFFRSINWQGEKQ